MRWYNALLLALALTTIGAMDSGDNGGQDKGDQDKGNPKGRGKKSPKESAKRNYYGDHS